MSRRLLIAVLISLVLAAPAGAAKPLSSSWAQPQIQAVVARGLMGTDVASFRPDDTLTQGALAQLVSGLTARPVAAPTNPSAPVTISGLDSRLVGTLGLLDASAAFAAGARAAGLAPPSRFGTEVVARMLGLRVNHPAALDDLELLPNDPATRAEAAYSGARILTLRGTEAPAVRGSASTFVLPALSPWQRRVLTVATGLVGYPYVWGGTSEAAEAPFGVQARGGFDCSGYVWRVFKLQSYTGGEALAATLKGRTTYAMSSEVPPAQRIAAAALQPADVIFFGPAGPRSKPAQVDHMGIYLGNGWFIHSSEYGVALTTLSGWYATRFAWARRPLAEAGLVSPL